MLYIWILKSFKAGVILSPQIFLKSKYGYVFTVMSDP